MMGASTQQRKGHDMHTQTFKAGDAVTWSRYGVTHRGTVVETPRGNTVIIRDHATWSRTWAALASLSRAEA
jgi:hypothetical protein